MKLKLSLIVSLISLMPLTLFAKTTLNEGISKVSWHTIYSQEGQWDASLKMIFTPTPSRFVDANLNPINPDFNITPSSPKAFGFYAFSQENPVSEYAAFSLELTHKNPYEPFKKRCHFIIETLNGQVSEITHEIGQGEETASLCSWNITANGADFFVG